MLLSILSNINYEFYNQGRPKSTNRSYSERDIMQFLKLAAGNILRTRYYEEIKRNGKSDLSLISPLLSIQEFLLGDPNEAGMRRADMSAFDLYRMPHDTHFSNVYPIGCVGTESQAIAIIESGEEYYYLKPDFKSFKFGVVKGRGINTYNLPPCATAISVEAPFDGTDKDGNMIDVDIPLDICYDASNYVLGRVIGIPDFMNKGVDNPYTIPQKNLKSRINPQQPE
jgi:hypothetical protein